MGYIPTENDSIILKTTETTIDLDKYITRYQIIKESYLTLPEEKTTPDQETLDKYNNEVGILREDLLYRLKVQAASLYHDLKPIHDAGLLPSRYEDEYNQLESFINT